MISTLWSPASHRTGSGLGRRKPAQNIPSRRNPSNAAPKDDLTIVLVKVSGTFDGSPANLTDRFGFAGDRRIGALEVR